MDNTHTYTEMKSKRLQSFKPNQVKMTEDYCVGAYEKELTYLHLLSPDRLLAGFRETAGLEARAPRYEGWEVTEIQGHTLGHYLSAIAQAYAYDGNSEFKERIDYICEELKVCQAESGYLFAWAEEIFDRVEQRKPAWVPWYTMHKVLKGLVQAADLAKNKVAFEVASKLGDWVFDRTSKWTPELQSQVLSVEYGGMNDVLYDLYKLTKKEAHLVAAQSFDELPLFEALYNNQDVLNGRHANTTIPKINGAMNRYLVTGEEYFLTVAMNFWNIVTTHHTYITGGNSEWEHFGRPDILDEERTACNCETCNTYNMLRLTQKLFEVTKDRKYAAFYEKTWINAILASQNPATGMTTYFQPMEAGLFKVYSSAEEHFWCCTGTGMENFTKLQQAIYFHNEEEVVVSRYISSKLNWSDKGVYVEVKTAFPDLSKVVIEVTAPAEGIKGSFVIPEWTDNQFTLSCNGQAVEAVSQEGYVTLMLQGTQTLEFNFTMQVKCERLPDNKSAVAFKYGPIVLCGLLGDEGMRVSQTGVNVSVATKDFWIKDHLVLQEGIALEAYLEQISEYLEKEEGLTFTLKGTDTDLTFVPYFSQHTERYGIYFRMCEANSKEQQEIEEVQKRKWSRIQQSIDCIPVGNDQYELSHRIRGWFIDITSIDGHRGRRINENGWLEYLLDAPTEGDCVLNLVYCSEDAGCEFDIYINQKLLTHEKITAQTDNFYTKTYDLTHDYFKETGKIELLIKVEQSASYTQIFDEIFLSKKSCH